MKSRMFHAVWMLVAGGLLLSAGPRVAAAEAMQVAIDSPFVRCIQQFGLNLDNPDHVYLVVTGVAKGEAVSARHPSGETSAWQMTPTARPVNPKKPLTLWSGELANGEFVLLTVTLMHGNQPESKAVQAYLAKKAEAEKAVKGLDAKTLSKADFTALTKGLHKAHVTLAKGVKKMLSRSAKTDSFGGAFTVAVLNDGGKVVKRATPLGLTTGEHYGFEPKMYSKIKYTLENVLYQEDDGEWYEFQEAPLNYDEDVLRVKMLETELVAVKGEAEPVRNVTDYLVDVRVTANGKAQVWELDGEHPGPTIVHDYWDWAK